ncbi:MAG: hypothetical protein U1E66_14565 [Rhodospirillales bacterium]
MRLRARAQGLLVLLTMSGLAGCGAPEPPNIRDEFEQGIKQLGMHAIYPLSESPRLGDVLLVDTTAWEEGGDVAAYIPASIVVTDAAVPFMEEARSARMEAKKRYPCSADNLGEQMNPDRSYYRQSTCAAPGAAKPATPAAPQAGAATTTTTTTITTVTAPPAPAAAARPGAPAAAASAEPSAQKAPESLAPLALVGLPSYTLASVDNFSLAGTAPTAFANFLAAIGWRQTSSLRVEAEGVEIADLPNDKFFAAISKACHEPGNPFSNRPPVVPNISMNVVTPTTGTQAGQSGGTQAPQPNAATAGDIAALQSQVDALRSAINSNANIQAGATYARATARGIEFVELFQRPLAFGYLAFIPGQAFDPKNGYSDFCTYADGNW